MTVAATKPRWGSPVAPLRRWLAAAGRLPGRFAAVLAPVARFLRPVERGLRPVLNVVRPFGWGVMAGLAVSLAAALRFGWVELLVISVGLATALAVGAGFVIGRSTYAVELDLARLRVRVGDEAFGALTIENTSARGLLPALFLLPVGGVLASFAVPRLAGRERHEESFAIPTDRRAVLPLGPVRSGRGDPFGMLRREWIWTEQVELFVHPRTVVLDGLAFGILRDLEGSPTDDLSSSDIAFHALRDYVVGDDLRHVHWKTTAKVGRIMVRQFEETRRSHLVVCLSTDPADYATEEDFELAVSVAASLGEQTLKEERDLTVMVPGRPLQTRLGTRLLDDFSRLELGAQPQPAEHLTQDAADLVPDASVAVLVSGGELPAARINRAMLRFGIDVTTLAVRCAGGLPLSRRAIGNSAVLNLGDLSDLPRGLRAVSG